MSGRILLTRNDFREGVFSRDNHACVFCGSPAKDAHHIIERRLFPDGGYYLNNGASVCEAHHLDCEKTIISVEDVRIACGISKPVIPPHLYNDQPYDKWGNPIMPNGMRMKGELFHDESVQKILKEGGVLDQFTNWVKYPRTHHVPWSPGMNSDDRMLESTNPWIGKEVVVTEKRDGENTSLYSDHVHARSMDSKHHWTQSWVKQFWSQICADIPEGWRICGENIYAKHSIKYSGLESYFEGFSIWNERNVCLNWKETQEWFEILGIKSVPVLYYGAYDEEVIKSLWKNEMWDSCEGYVIRPAHDVNFNDFKTHFGKFVRKGHLQSIDHWRYGKRDIEINGMIE